MTTDDRLKRVMSRIRDVPDFPKPGILFKDVTPLLGDGAAFRLVTDLLFERVGAKPPELIVGIESRGFIFGAALAERLGVGFVPVRKPGKLPFKTTRETYSLEYGTDALEMHDDAIRKGQRVLIVDDLLATGGTARATTELVKRLGGQVHALAFLIELVALNGRAKLDGEQIHTVLKY
jgi:adenine phosphoribosyltransferase